MAILELNLRQVQATGLAREEGAVGYICKVILGPESELLYLRILKPAVAGHAAALPLQSLYVLVAFFTGARFEQYC